MKKFIISLMLISTLITSAFTVAYADVQTGFTTASALNVRTKAGTDGEVLGLLPYNSKVTITDTQDNWYAICYKDATAYVSRDYIRVNVDEIVDDTVQNKGAELVQKAKEYIGVPYVYGGTTPKGFDCSGFTKYIYALFGITLNRTSSSQLANGYAVSTSELKEGDLVFFGSNISHVGIYVGSNYFIHSPRPGKSVEITTFSAYGSNPVKARRIF